MPNEKSDLSKPPLNILVNPEEIRSKRPWEVDILKLLEIFLEILEKMDTPDLRLCGSAALSSALIYRLKVESLFIFEKLKVKHRITDAVEPPLIEMPYRYELSATSLEDLVSTLESVLNEMFTRQVEKPKPSIIEVEPVLEVDTISVHIQKALTELRHDVAATLRDRGSILFSEYVHNMDIVGRLRTFLLLLFIANEGLIRLIQDEEDLVIVSVALDVSQ